MLKNGNLENKYRNDDKELKKYMEKIFRYNFKKL